MALEQQIEELRSELGACMDRDERRQIESELAEAKETLARLEGGACPS